jgi:citrate lyase subunit beta/citryl-CoA lyase
MLFVPADSERKLARAGDAGADALILDLEDSVSMGRKPIARVLAASYLETSRQGPPVWIRVNDLHSGELLNDLVALVPAGPAGFVLPKIYGPDDVDTVACYLEALEAANATVDPLPIIALVTETPLAVLRMADLASDPPRRLAGISWGAEDLSAALGAGDPRLPSGAWRPVYEHARHQCLLAAHALSIQALDTVYVKYQDAAGFEASCLTSRHDGFTGRLAIHPDQVAIINRVFSPSTAELDLAQRIIDAFSNGEGAVSLDGKMYDLPHLKAAQRLLASRPRDQSDP